MNWDQVEGNWKQFSGSIRKNWGKLTDDDMQKAKGSREQLEGVIQERYGQSKEEVKNAVDTFLGSSTGTQERRH